MPATPQMNNIPPNKFSPFGGAINKSLLTPCRRVGLSRKRKTPNSILKLNSENSASSPLSSESTPIINKNDRRRSKINLDSRMNENEALSKDENCYMSNSSLPLKTTPVNNKNITNKRKSKMNFDSPMKETVVQNSEKVAVISSSESKAKNSLSLVNSVNVDHSYILKEVQNEQKLAPTEILEPEKELEEEVLAALINTEYKDEKTLLQSEDKLIITVRDDDSSSCDSIVLPKSKKTKVLYDSDEDFLPSYRNKLKLKRIKSETPLVQKSRIKLISKTNSENMVDNLKNCKITLHKLSEDEIVSMESRQHLKKNIINDSSDDEIVAKVKKKKLVVLSDDDDFDTNPKTATCLGQDKFVNDLKNLGVKTESQTVCVKEESTLPKKASFIDILEDEEDAFTSTPDKDKNEKKDLIEKITNLERKNKVKRKLLDDLKQASVYQSIHNIKDLQELTVKYREGCVNGLKELLSQLQAHSPINMNTLLTNLRIPSEMITRLYISDES